MPGEGEKGGVLVPVGPKEGVSAKPGEIHETVGSASTGVVTTAQEVLDFETDGYFTSMLEGADFRDESVKSLHKRLSEMDDLLGDSVDFGNKAIFEKISQMPKELDRVKYIEGLFLRLALVLQELQISMNLFLKGGNSNEDRSFKVVKTMPDGEVLDGVLFNPKNKGEELRLAIACKTSLNDNQTRDLVEYSYCWPLYFGNSDNSNQLVVYDRGDNDYYLISKNSKLLVSIYNWEELRLALPLFVDQRLRWHEPRFIRIAYGKRSSYYAYSFLSLNQKLVASINNGEITLDIYDDILKRIQALAFQVGDIGKLLNEAREEARKKIPKGLPKIKF